MIQPLKGMKISERRRNYELKEDRGEAFLNRSPEAKMENNTYVGSRIVNADNSLREICFLDVNRNEKQ